MKKEKNLFNPAFQTLQEKIKEARKPEENPGKAAPERPEALPDAEDLFLEAMTGVDPLPGDQKRINPTPGPRKSPSHPAPDEEREVMTHLYGLVRGSEDMDITFSDEYMEGSIRGVSRKTMKRLKKGLFPVQDYIDLHGLTRQDAEIKVRDFLIQSRKLGHRCVLIVHGRGLNSPDSFPVLKEGLPRWLGRGPVRKIVLAFATARPYDGGTGAIYVLLRRR